MSAIASKINALKTVSETDKTEAAGAPKNSYVIPPCECGLTSGCHQGEHTYLKSRHTARRSKKSVHAPHAVNLAKSTSFLMFVANF